VWSSPVQQNIVFEYFSEDIISDTVPDARHEPIDFSNLFIDDSVLEMMVTETNRNAHQVLGQKALSPESFIANWIDSDKYEIRLFLGLVIWMGLVGMPTLDAYWRESVIYNNSVASKTMTRNRFQLHLRLWHFADNTAIEPNDRLHTIRDLANLL